MKQVIYPNWRESCCRLVQITPCPLSCTVRNLRQGFSNICEVALHQPRTSTSRWWRSLDEQQGCPVTWPNEVSKRIRRLALTKRDHGRLVTSLTLWLVCLWEEKNHITNKLKCYATASCIMLPATSSIENWAVNCLQLPSGSGSLQIHSSVEFYAGLHSWLIKCHIWPYIMCT